MHSFAQRCSQSTDRVLKCVLGAKEDLMNKVVTVVNELGRFSFVENNDLRFKSSSELG